MKVRRLSITVKITAMVLMLLLISDCAIGISLFIRSKNALEYQIKANAKNLAQCVAASVPGDKLVTITQDNYEENDAFTEIRDELTLFLENADVQFVYTVRQRADGTTEFVVDSDPENPGMPGDEFGDDGEEIIGAYAGNTTVTEDAYTDEWGDHYSAYSPIYDGNKVVGLAVIDISADAVQKQTRNLLIVIVGILVVAAVAGIVITGIINYTLSKGFKTLNGKISELSDGNGDLTRTINLSGGDEFEVIASNVNRLMDYIRGILLTVKQNSDEMKQASERMAASADSTFAAADGVSVSMESMRTAMNDISESLHNIDDIIQSSTGEFNEIVSQIREGEKFSDGIYREASETGKNAVAMEDQVAKKVGDMAASLEVKIKESHAVDQISVLTENIISITEQTNLLSLNASIEAARAGESGRGFAVVASEIGKLAQDSADAATKIKEVSANVIAAVEGLTSEAQKMVEFMNETAVGGYESLVVTSGNYRETAERIDEMMKAFKELSGSIQDKLQNVRNLTDSLSDSVDGAANNVASTTEKSLDISRSMKTMSEDAHTGSEISIELQTNVNRFRLE